MTVIGGDVAEGVAVETAIANAGERLDGATGELFERAGRRSDTLRVDVREAFLGRGGPAVPVPSPRVQGAVALLAVAGREGRPAGDVLLELADQLEELRELENDARRQRDRDRETLTNTAAVFAPLVGGDDSRWPPEIDAVDAGDSAPERRPAQTRSAVPVVSVTRAQSVPKRAERRAGGCKIGQRQRTLGARARTRSSARTC